MGTCVPVLCELEEGIQHVRREAIFRRHLRILFQRIKIWPLDPAMAPINGTIAQDLRARGRVLSKVDLMLAAMALLWDLTILTTDQNFAVLPHIRTENWIPPPP